jgi:site-specific DNA-cytosine methylase
VPRIATRGRHLLDQIVALLRSYGYATAETTHDCGEIGGLAQSRKRFLLVARHQVKVPPFLYEPPKRPLRGVGEVLERLPVPSADTTLPMHRMSSLQWKTWVRLALVEAGKDWRSLNRLAVEDGVLRDYGIAADVGWHGGVFGVKTWDEPSATVTGRASPTTGAYAVADPRIDGHEKSVQMGVRRWDQPAGVVTGKMFAGGGPHSVADPRLSGTPRFNNTFRIVPWANASPAVAGPGGPAGGLAVADPRTGWPANAHQSKLAVQRWDGPSKTVTGSDRVGSGALSVADPRPEAFREGKEAYTNGGHYGVVPWDRPSYAVTGSGQHDNGRWSVADPREAVSNCYGLPEPGDRLVAVIRALDGTWHRPFTTLELASIQSLVDPEEVVEFDGLSDSAKRERIGNAVPSEAAEAMAGTFGRTLLLAWNGETFMLSSEPIWVRNVAVGLMAATG